MLTHTLTHSHIVCKQVRLRSESIVGILNWLRKHFGRDFRAFAIYTGRKRRRRAEKGHVTAAIQFHCINCSTVQCTVSKPAQLVWLIMYVYMCVCVCVCV
jgi:hypothetical protein